MAKNYMVFKKKINFVGCTSMIWIIMQYLSKAQ